MGGLLHKTDKFGLCLGCGLCESVFGSDRCRLELGDDGYFHPVFSPDLKEDACVAALCPGIHEDASCNGELWGKVYSVVQAWASDSDLRFRAASGGAVSALLISALESGLADAVLQVGSSDGLTNELKISRTKEQITANAGSRYAPAAMLRDIVNILEKSEERYAFVGKPCDIAALVNFLELFPRFKSRFSVKIAVFCAGMPGHLAARQLAGMAGKGEASSIRFRGNGWPGKFTASFPDGSVFSMSYEDSWGAHLGRNLGIRCKICPDGIGLLADIAVGDSWNLRDGRPVFDEDEGRSLCLVRSGLGGTLLDGAVASGLLCTSPWSLEKAALQQPYQYRRRLVCKYRMAPVRILFGRAFRMTGMDISSKSGMKPGLRERFSEAKGSAKRVLRKLIGKR